MLEQYPISDFLAWLDEKSLILNAEFQRRNVWPPSTKTYLIDTILKGRPMPNIMIRSLIDIKTKKTKSCKYYVKTFSFWSHYIP